MGKIYAKKSPVHLMRHEECTVLQVALTRWNSYCQVVI